MKVDTAVLHSLVKRGKVKAAVGHGVGQKDKTRRTAIGTGCMTDRQKARRVRMRQIDGSSRWGSGAREDGDFAVLDVELNSSFLSHASPRSSWRRPVGQASQLMWKVVTYFAADVLTLTLKSYQFFSIEIKH